MTSVADNLPYATIVVRIANPGDDVSGGSRILKRGVRIIRCAKSGKNFKPGPPVTLLLNYWVRVECTLKRKIFAWPRPLSVKLRPLNLQSISSACARTKSKLAVL